MKKKGNICDIFVLYLAVEWCGKTGENGNMDGEWVRNLYELSVGKCIYCEVENDNSHFVGKRVIFTKDRLRVDYE